jgi:hypothetical protein
MLKLKPLTLSILVALLPGSLAGQARVGEDEILQTSASVGAREAALELELASGRTVAVRLAGGRVLVNSSEVAAYRPGGPLERAWRDLVRSASSDELAQGWQSFLSAGRASEDQAAITAIAAALGPLFEGVASPAPAPLVAPAPGLPAAAQDEPLAPGPTVEAIVGGLVVRLTERPGLARALARLGLDPELAVAFNGDLRLPARFVIEAEEYRLPEGAALDEMLVLINTDGVVAGTIASNVLVAGGSLLILPSARIDGDVLAVDATVHNQGTIVGALREGVHLAPMLREGARRGPLVEGRRLAPWPRDLIRRELAPRPSIWSNALGGIGSLAKTLAIYVLFAFLGALAVYFFRAQLETVSDTLSHSFGRSFLAGIAAQVLFLPVLLVMVVLIITAIAVPFYVLGFGLAALFGYLAVAHAAGENLTRHRSWAARLRHANSYYYVLTGLGVLLALFVAAAFARFASPVLGWARGLLFAAAWILTWVASSAGLGATLLSRAGTRRTYSRPRELPELPLATSAAEFDWLERRAGSAGPGGEQP